MKAGLTWLLVGVISLCTTSVVAQQDGSIKPVPHQHPLVSSPAAPTTTIVKDPPMSPTNSAPSADVLKSTQLEISGEIKCYLTLENLNNKTVSVAIKKGEFMTLDANAKKIIPYDCDLLEQLAKEHQQPDSLFTRDKQSTVTNLILLIHLPQNLSQLQSKYNRPCHVHQQAMVFHQPDKHYRICTPID